MQRRGGDDAHLPRRYVPLRYVLLAVAAVVLLTSGVVTAGLVGGADTPAAVAPTETTVSRPVPPPGPARDVEVGRSEVRVPPDARVAMTVVRDLVAIGPRPAGSDADQRTRAYLVERLRDAGWTVSEGQIPLLQGGVTANVIAWQGGDDPRRGQHVVVGAHHDTVPGSPGGNDNASGVGVLVTLAERLRGEDLPVPLVLVGFAAEERQPDGSNHHGSRRYAETHGDAVQAMISADMLGHGPSTCICSTGSDALAARLRKLADSRDIGPFHVRAIGGVSDHAAFAQRGVPSVLLYTELEPRYHSPRDTDGHVGLDELRRAADLVATYVRNVRG